MSKKIAAFVIIENTLTDRIKKYAKLTLAGGEIDIKAKKAVGLQLLNNIVNGSLKESVIPPIMTGRLRASGSVFVGNKHVGNTSEKAVIGEKPTPNKTYSGKNDTITVGFNTPYAARWHEEKFTPGGKKPSKIAERNPGILTNVGNKYVEKHLKADGKELMHLYADIVRGETSKV